MIGHDSDKLLARLGLAHVTRRLRHDGVVYSAGTESVKHATTEEHTE
ncbi:hypothetical protein HJ581_0040885 [Rhodococcus opacus]|nr:hypothetical protein HJ581_0040885 [Rhodococcus opacus]